MSYFFVFEVFVSFIIYGSDQIFLVWWVYCVGCNYVVYVWEMGFDFECELLFFFCKLVDVVVLVVVGSILELVYLSQIGNYYYEIELVVVIGKGGCDIFLEQVEEYVWGYVVGLDMICCDLQMCMCEMGWFWEIGKVFDCLVLIGLFYFVSQVGYLCYVVISFQVDGEDCQCSDIDQLIWLVVEIISYLLCFFELCFGDLVFIGILEGVGVVECGEWMFGVIDGFGEFSVCVV